MKEISINGNTYRLPNSLNSFQQKMYIHLIDWKWQHITREPGSARGSKYDAILPDTYSDEFPQIYPAAVPVLKDHLQRFPFRTHKYFNHMASSQAANVNLFLPLLNSPEASAILATIKFDFAELANSELDNGYRIEFWDEPHRNLGDKTEVSGTDSDIGISYYNHQGELCLWLIEHKLTESEFTECGGYKSNGRTPKHDCSKTFMQILQDKQSCYYHDKRKFNYWNITESNQGFFFRHAEHETCPFRGGMNQLWRNQLLAMSIEQDDRQPYKHVYFSVVKHQDNHHLNETLTAYQHMIDGAPSFSIFTSADVVNAVQEMGGAGLSHWVDWYRRLYRL